MLRDTDVKKHLQRTVRHSSTVPVEEMKVPDVAVDEVPQGVPVTVNIPEKVEAV